MRNVIINGGIAYISPINNQEKNIIRNSLIFNRKDCFTKDITSVSASQFFTSPYGEVAVVPRCYPLGIYPKIINKGSLGFDTNIKPISQTISENFNGINQEFFVKTVVNQTLKNNIGGFGQAGCGTGKTRMGAEIARRLGKSALIIVGRNYQIEQWQKEVESMYGFCPGIYQQKIKDIPKKESPFVIGMIDSLRNCKDKKYFSMFGTTIIDECHHIPAKSWIDFFLGLRSYYILGLTATLIRSDKMENFFKLLIGNTICQIDSKKTKKKGSVVMINLPFGCRAKKGTQNIFVAKSLYKKSDRNKIIARIVFRYYRENRDIFVFSLLVKHLELLATEIIRLGVTSVGILDSSCKNIEDTKKKKVVLTTFQMATEGLNIPQKDTLISAVPPPYNLRQLKGRIDREYKGKQSPLVIDFIDNNNYLKNKGMKRDFRWKNEFHMKVWRVNWRDIEERFPIPQEVACF